MHVNLSPLQLAASSPGSGGGRRDQAIVAAVAGLAQLGVPVLAEGVETPEQLDKVRELRIDFVQGYLFGRPASAATIMRVFGIDLQQARFAAELSGPRHCARAVSGV